MGSPDDYEIEMQAWLRPDTPFRNSKRRLNRAAEHLQELVHLFREFQEANAGRLYVVIDVANPPDKGGDWTVDWSESRTPSSKIGVLAGEIVYNLRAALDYLIYALAQLDSGKVNERSQFPIEERAEKYWQERRHSWLGGVNDEHAARLATYQPFDGCIWTRTLRDLSNVDKHRQLTPINPKWTGRLPPAGTVFDLVPGDPSRARSPLWDQVPQIHLAERYPLLETLDHLGRNVGAFIRAFEGDFSQENPNQQENLDTRS